MTRPRYIAKSEDDACYCGTPCEETGARWNSGVLCGNCQKHSKHDHCDEGHCVDEHGGCDCFVCVMCGEHVEEGERYCSRSCDYSDNGPPDSHYDGCLRGNEAQEQLVREQAEAWRLK